MQNKNQISENTGHRQRLLDKFEKSGFAGFLDYEIIELLLTFVISRKDTKPIAKDLLSQFKTINGILNATQQEISSIKGLGKKSFLFFSLIKETLSYALNERYEKKSVFSKHEDVENYLRLHFGNRRDEYMVALYLDNANTCLSTDIIAEGTVNQCVVYPRVVMEKAITSGASSIIIAHNHPGGSTTASDADWNITKKLYEAGKLLEIRLLDHLIIAKNKVVSLRNFPQWPR